MPTGESRSRSPRRRGATSSRSATTRSYGARPLKRAIQRELETPLGRKILAGEIREGQSVLVDYDERKGELTFTAGLPDLPESLGALKA